MSAFVVSDRHIDAMVQAAITLDLNCYLPDGTHGRVTRHTATEIGRELLRENARSVAFRYREAPASHEHYEFRPFPAFGLGPLGLPPSTVQTIVAIVKACHCYDYQACETDDYRDTWAARFVGLLEGSAIHKLPGYNAAPWGIEEPTHTVERIVAA